MSKSALDAVDVTCYMTGPFHMISFQELSASGRYRDGPRFSQLHHSIRQEALVQTIEGSQMVAWVVGCINRPIGGNGTSGWIEEGG